MIGQLKSCCSTKMYIVVIVHKNDIAEGIVIPSEVYACIV